MEPKIACISVVVQFAERRLALGVPIPLLRVAFQSPGVHLRAAAVEEKHASDTIRYPICGKESLEE